MTEVQLTKLADEINRLEGEIRRLEAEAEFLYPSTIATKKRNTAKELRKQREFLESAQRGEVDMECLPRLEAKIAQINREIGDLNAIKVGVYKEMSLFKRLLEVINK